MKQQTQVEQRKKSKISIEEVKVKDLIDICHHFGSKEKQTNKKHTLLVVDGACIITGDLSQVSKKTLQLKVGLRFLRRI